MSTTSWSWSSYQVRLVLGYAGVLTLLAAVWAWSLYGPLTAAVIDQQRTHLDAVARTAAVAVVANGGASDLDVEGMMAGTGLRLTVVGPDGTVLADSESEPESMENHADRPEIRAALGGRTGFASRTSPTQGTEQLYAAAPARVGSETLAVRVSETRARVDSLAASARDSGLVALVVAALLASALVWRLSSRAAEPVARLAGAARTMASGDLRTPIPAESGELGDVSDALVALRDEISRRIDEMEAGQGTLETVLDALPDAVFLLEGGTVDYANGAASRLFGTPASEWPGSKLSSPAVPEPLVAAISHARSLGTPQVTEIGPDPLMRFLRLTTIPVRAYARGERTMAVVSDVTERQRVDAVRRDFVANASHELKTPASTIQLLAESASAAASDGDTATALAFVRQIEGEADRLRRLVTDLLDLSRLDAPPEPGTITDVREALDRAIAGHRPAAGAADLELTSDLSRVEGEDLYANADPTDVAVALDNVLANAITYTERGAVDVLVTADRATVRIAVSDTGIGIPAEHLSRVFERFYRVDAARTRDSGGTGLGLSLVRNAVERSGGTVEIDSTVGEGTTVTLVLPRAV